MKGLCQNTNPRKRLLEEIAMNVSSVVSLHLVLIYFNPTVQVS